MSTSYFFLFKEDSNVNRLDESLNLFGQIVNNPFFREALFILFLNKFDLFREKILYSQRHLRLYFPDYKGKLLHFLSDLKLFPMVPVERDMTFYN